MRKLAHIDVVVERFGVAVHVLCRYQESESCYQPAQSWFYNLNQSSLDQCAAKYDAQNSQIKVQTKICIYLVLTVARRCVCTLEVFSSWHLFCQLNQRKFYCFETKIEAQSEVCMKY